MYSGFESTLAPTSRKYAKPFCVGTIEPRAGRSTPLIRPWIKSAAAMMAPEFPAEVQPSARPSLHRRAQTAIDESGLLRTAWAGCSSMAIACVQGTNCGLRAFAELTHRLVALGLGLAPDDLHVLARSLRDLEQRRLRHIQVSAVDDGREVAEEEREQKRADMTAVDVGVGHRHDAVISDLLDVEVVADASAHGRDEVANLVGRQNLVESSLFDVEDLAAQRQNRLRAPVAAALGVAELPLRLALELRLQHLDADHGGEAFAHVLAGEVWILLFEDSCLPRVAVQHVGERRPKPGQVGAALDRVDGVRKCDHVLYERVVVLEGDLDLGAFDLAVDVERRVVHDRLVAVQGADEGDDAALEVKRARVAEDLVGERDLEALVQVGHLAQTVEDDVTVEPGLGADRWVGPESDDGACAVGLAHRLEAALRHAPLVLLVVHLAAPMHPDLEALA